MSDRSVEEDRGSGSDQPKFRYLASYVFHPHERPFTREVYASSREEALESAKVWRAPYWKETAAPRVYVSDELHPCADHNGSTHGD